MSKNLIGIAGATGFVGQSLIKALGPENSIVGLSRRPQQVHPSYPQLYFRPCHMFNLLETEKALSGVHTAYYLVHSMQPQSQLSQGNFRDIDLLCADNFARAAYRVGVQHIIYVGGIIPQQEERDRSLSEHLRSRLEVEQTLGSYGVPLTALRAGLVLGANGSSSEMMLRLVRHLPFMLLPSWTRSETEPIALEDLIHILLWLKDHPECQGIYEIGCQEVVTYEQMLTLVAKILNKKYIALRWPLLTVSLSALWVSLISRQPMALVWPLLQSLKHRMVVTDGYRLQRLAGLKPLGLEASLRACLPLQKDFKAFQKTPQEPKIFQSLAHRGSLRREHSVISVQRFACPKKKDAVWILLQYIQWLNYLKPWLIVKQKDNMLCISLGLLRINLLELSFAKGRSSADRQLFYITGGLLVNRKQPVDGRFEFRLVLGQSDVLTVVSDFMPSLPWLIYKYTQALLHQSIMRSFGRFIQRF